MSNLALTEAEEGRFWARVAKEGDNSCWVWQGALTNGYGRYSLRGRSHASHRISVMMAGTEIPAGMVVDHICRNRACVNPSHLRVVTVRENTLENSLSRSALNAKKTHCARGHILSGHNVIIKPNGYRSCRPCKNIWKSARNKGAPGRPAADLASDLTDDQRSTLMAAPFLSIDAPYSPAVLGSLSFYQLMKLKGYKKRRDWLLTERGVQVVKALPQGPTP